MAGYKLLGGESVELGYLRPNTPAERRRAAKTVRALARSAKDADLLLAALDLTDEETGNE